MIELKKKGESINLSKSNKPIGEILVNLNWSLAKQQVGFFSTLFKSQPQNTDLDLGCLYELKSGEKGCVQALGNVFGSFEYYPYMQLDADDRTGAISGGENLRINGSRISEINRIVIYAFIYEGAANWSEADGVVTLTYQNGEGITVKLDEHRNGQNMCAIAMVENVDNRTFKVERLVEYFNGHKQMDRAYNWGMNWVAGTK
ncbi:Tellurium resistance [Pseudalkalibacillus hwajinpoensis]|uniref:Tellurium resistance n=1 Tax=Guptibacillus hwajinpoensis TaxID=208199 RepID=A0A4U1MB62_9BACL|nr:Tellurium resistance [Pseudalkalibacillus hwajinpoensis]TKD68259.1 Tellurium resistance [Pseudalkalibacillus hwajinpoensis]